MDWITVLRALHVVSVVHWIGGVAFVTLVVLPAVGRTETADRRIALFEAVENGFAAQARWSVTLAGATGLAMTHLLGAWDRFLSPAFWWMHLMLALWVVFSIVLFVAEPLFLHDWFRRRAAHDADGTFRLVRRFHLLLLTLSAVAVAGGVLGAHGALY
ncbi:MAG: hypothetical protein WAT70_14495 [Rhizobiaceae bacterium]